MKKLLAITLSLLMLLPTIAVPSFVSAAETITTVNIDEDFADIDMTDAVDGIIKLSKDSAITEFYAKENGETYRTWKITRQGSNRRGWFGAIDSTYAAKTNGSNSAAYTFDDNALYFYSTGNNQEFPKNYISADLDNPIVKDGKTIVSFSYAFGTNNHPSGIAMDIGGICFTINGGDGNNWFYTDTTLTNKVATSIALSPITLYDISIEFDWKTNTYNLLCAEHGKTKTTVVPNGTLTPNADSDANKIIIYSCHNDWMYSAIVDDIYVSTETAVTTDYIAAELESAIPGKHTGSIELPTVLNGAEITWECDNEALEIADGTEADTKIINAIDTVEKATLTATITIDDVSVPCAFDVTLIPSNIVFYEDFEDAAAWVGENEWTSKVTAWGTEYGFESSIVTDSRDGENTKAGKLARMSDGTNLNDILVEKNFTNNSGASVHSVKFKFRISDEANSFKVRFGGNDISNAFQLKLKDNALYYNDGSSFTGDPTNPLLMRPGVRDEYEGMTDWHTVEIIADTQSTEETDKFDFYFDGILMAKSIGLDKATASATAISNPLNNIGFSVIRNNWGDNGAYVLIDDITVSAGVTRASGNYAVTGYTFADSNGENESAVPVAGGKVKSVTITRDNDTAPQGIVAVYSNGALFDVVPFQMNEAAKSGTKIVVNADLPANVTTGLEIKTFVWDSLETLKPVIEAVSYSSLK